MTRNRSEGNPSRHHTFWTFRDYQQDPVTRRLRNDTRTHVYLPQWIHTELHKDIEPVPRPVTEIGRLALDHLYDAPDYYSSVDHVKNLANFLHQHDEGLAINLDRQMPYLTLGTIALKRTTLG